MLASRLPSQMRNSVSAFHLLFAVYKHTLWLMRSYEREWRAGKSLFYCIAAIHTHTFAHTQSHTKHIQHQRGQENKLFFWWFQKAYIRLGSELYPSTFHTHSTYKSNRATDQIDHSIAIAFCALSETSKQIEFHGNAPSVQPENFASPLIMHAMHFFNPLRLYRLCIR